jgi:hypothetical protein
MTAVTIGFIPRERFSVAAQALQRIFDLTQIPFRLIVVDCNIPDRYRQQMDDVLEGRDNVTTIRTDHHILSNQSRNLAIRENKDDFLCLIENDVLVEEGWLTHLIEACEQHPADVAVPLILERMGGFEKVHFDDRLGHIEAFEAPDGDKLRILPRGYPKENDRYATRRTTEFIETHCILFRKEILSRIGGFDDSITAQEEMDLSLSLYHAHARVVMEPQSVINFLPPPPVNPDEVEYYHLKWDQETYARDYEHVAQKWNVADMPSAMGVVKARREYTDDSDPQVQLRRQMEYRQKLAATADDIAAFVPEGEGLILVHEEQLDLGDVAPERRVSPFLEHDGQYWGSPENDEVAIRELERMRREGASRIAFAWPAFWWLEYYAGLHRHLRDNYRCVLNNDRLVAFELQ